MKKKLLLLILMLGLSTVLTACFNDDEIQLSPTALALVVGNHSNAQGIPYNSTDISDWVIMATTTFGRATVIGADGDPKTIIDVNIPEQSSGLSAAKLEAIATSQASEILNVAASWQAETPELDTLTAIFQGVRSLSTSSYDNKVLLIADTGLSTSGVLNFSQNLLNRDTDDILDYLVSTNNIPDLAGIDVVWIGLGDTAEPQADLTRSQVVKLQEIWEAILMAGNPNTLTFLTTLPDSSFQIDDGPSITTIEASEDIFYNFGEEYINFVGNSEQFVDEDAAKSALLPVVDDMNTYSNLELLIVGTTASGDTSFCQALSEARALKVKDTLVNLGVDANRLTTVGLGFSDPWHVDDLENGSLTDAASINRKVVILDIDSTSGQAILAGNY